MSDYRQFEEMNGHFQILGGLVRNSGLQFDTLLGILFNVPSEVHNVTEKVWQREKADVLTALSDLEPMNKHIEDFIGKVFKMGYGACLIEVMACECVQERAKATDDKDR